LWQRSSPNSVHKRCFRDWRAWWRDVTFGLS
jgi:hypothetical protein